MRRHERTIFDEWQEVDTVLEAYNSDSISHKEAVRWLRRIGLDDEDIESYVGFDYDESYAD